MEDENAREEHWFHDFHNQRVKRTLKPANLVVSVFICRHNHHRAHVRSLLPRNSYDALVRLFPMFLVFSEVLGSSRGLLAFPVQQNTYYLGSKMSNKRSNRGNRR